MYQFGTGYKSRNQRDFFTREIKEYIIDETAIKAGSELIWLWVAIEPWNKGILGFNISKERQICL